jgi:hypothetical protein
VKMIPFNNKHTEGTPPWTVPAPVKFISGTQLSKGYFNFKVTNMRQNMSWVLFQGSLTSDSGFAVVAMSPVVVFTDVDAPSHGRLARTSAVNEMRVSWTTNQNHANSQVQFGDSATNLQHVSHADSQPEPAYSNNTLCGAPASTFGFHSPGFFFTTVLDLSMYSTQSRLNGQRVFYKFGSPSGWSSVRSFLAPKPANPDVPLSVIITADMGETYEDGSQYHWEEPSAVNTITHISTFVNEHGAELVLHPGDLSYATGYESEWDRFMESIEPASSGAPYMTGQGNHERDFPLSGNSIGDGDSGGECGVPTQARFHMPTCAEPNIVPCIGNKTRSAAPALTLSNSGRGPKPTSPADDGWYSFEQGPAHFLMMNTEKSSKNGSRQHTFIRNDMMNVNRSVTPWVFVLGHRQMYSGNFMSPQNEMNDVEELLVQFKVDIAFWGHIHFAQASCPMYQGKCVTVKDEYGYDAPIHLIIGNAGQSLTKLPTKNASWSLWNDAHWGFSHMTISNSTHLTVDFYTDAPLGSPPIHSYAVDVKRKKSTPRLPRRRRRP